MILHICLSLSENIQYVPFSDLFHWANALKIHTQRQDFLLLYGRIFQCLCVCVSDFLYPFIYWWMNTGCSHILATVKIAAMNRRLQIFFFFLDIVILFPLEKYLEVKLLGKMVFYFQFLWVLSIWFSIMAAPVYIPTNSAKVSPIFSPTSMSYLFDTRHSDRYEMMFYCYFDLLFSDG